MLGPDQKAYIYGFIPVVVAKCGLYLKENGTTVEGIFRISGSTKRMKELQRLFDEPPLYGKDLDWRDPNPLEPNKQQPSSNSSPIDSNGKPYFPRYLMALPEPLIPTAMYQDFVQVLQRHADDTQKQIRLFKSLISTLNPPSQYLLLYLLDLLAVFANRSQLNLMTANNLALVFQPALCPTTKTLSRSEKFNRIINHHQNQQQQLNQHDINQTNPKDIQLESLREQGLIMREAKQAQEVLEFLIIKPAGPIPELSNDFDKDVARGECESEDEKRFKNVSTPKPSTTTTGSPMARRSLMNDPRLRSPSSCSIDEDELINNSQSSIKRSSILMRSKNGSLKDENLKMAANESVKRSKTLPSGHHHHLSKNSFRSNNDIFNQTVGTPVEALNQH
ncbi:Rho GTPase activation protein [Phakopsora pachyrhizi]|nr:Rho GTPase activation protein [Phakopsora pachyrhizi]